jgi:hypothetical protein
MKYLRKYKSLNESGRWVYPCPDIDDKFDLVLVSVTSKYDNPYYYLTSDVVKKLNYKNNNIDPSIIKDLFLDLFDDDVISNIEVKKIYHVNNYKNSEKKYAGYVLKVKVEFSDNIYNEENLKNRALYMERRDEVIQIITYDLHHRNLNYHLSKWNINDMSYSILENTYDEFDLWSLSLNLQTLK